MLINTSHDYMKTPADWLAVLSTYLATMVACSLVALALKSQRASVVVLVGTVEVPVAYLLQAFFTDNEVAPTMMIGAILSVAA